MGSAPQRLRSSSHLLVRRDPLVTDIAELAHAVMLQGDREFLEGIKTMLTRRMLWELEKQAHAHDADKRR